MTEHLGRPDWAQFVNTVVSDQNRFQVSERQSGALFDVLGKRFDLSGWRRLTGQDGASALQVR